MAQHLRGVTGQLRARVELPTARAGEGQVDHARAALCLQHPRHEYLLQREGLGLQLRDPDGGADEVRDQVVGDRVR
ncbi:hypothetical protein ACFXA4_09345, partial [Streptomyces sp. NPDC059442]|uniref:hypothetical protein n=1 Tax=Streptomyces sp. NPDC059442 TaxID=3346830 RepID=UPI0036D15366